MQIFNLEDSPAYIVLICYDSIQKMSKCDELKERIKSKSHEVMLFFSIRFSESSVSLFGNASEKIYF